MYDKEQEDKLREREEAHTQEKEYKEQRFQTSVEAQPGYQELQDVKDLFRDFLAYREESQNAKAIYMERQKAATNALDAVIRKMKDNGIVKAEVGDAMIICSDRNVYVTKNKEILYEYRLVG